MNRDRRNLKIVIIDILMLVIIVIACYMLLQQGTSSWNKNVCSLLIVLAIPTMFYVTASKVVERRLPNIEEEEDDENTLSEVKDETENKDTIEITEE